MDIDDAFQRFTVQRPNKNGFRITCKLGLWGVFAPTKDQAIAEARHYFVQYFNDGEYSEDKRDIKWHQ